MVNDLCSPAAMRPRALRGSPWLPVHSTTILSSGMSFTSYASIMSSWEIFRYPSSRAIFVLLTMERPVTTTLRPTAVAASHTCCSLWMWLENDATNTLPVAFLMMWRSCGPTAASDWVKPGLVALVESDIRRSMPSVPYLQIAW